MIERFFDCTTLLRKLLSIKIYFDFSNAQNDKNLCRFDLVEKSKLELL